MKEKADLSAKDDTHFLKKEKAGMNFLQADQKRDFRLYLIRRNNYLKKEIEMNFYDQLSKLTSDQFGLADGKAKDISDSIGKVVSEYFNSKKNTQKSDAAIEKQANDSIESEKSTKSDEINQKYDQKTEKNEDSAIAAGIKSGEKIAGFGETRTKKIEENKNNMIENGLARSSIFENSQKAIETDFDKKAKDEAGEYSQKLAAFNGSIAELERQRASALNDLDEKYAGILQDKIDTLKAERDKNLASYEVESDEYDEQLAIVIYENLQKLFDEHGAAAARKFLLEDKEVITRLTGEQYYELYKKYV